MDLAGKKILVTGGTSGLGHELVKLLHSAGSEVYVTGRKLKADFKEHNDFRFIPADFADLKMLYGSVKELINEDIHFDVVINNAGVLSPPDYQETKDGFEYSFQVNFLSHLIINGMILKQKAYNDPFLIVSVTSPVYRYVRPDFTIPRKKDYKSFRIYSESKFYVLLIGDFLKDEYPGSDFRFIGFNPGTFASGIYRMQKSWFRAMYRLAAPFMRSSGKVAESLVAVIKMDETVSNNIYSGPGQPEEFVYDKETAGKLFRDCNDAFARGGLSMVRSF